MATTARTWTAASRPSSPRSTPARPRATDEPTVAATRLRTAGRTLISTVGGAAGPLYGTAFMRAAGRVAAPMPDAVAAAPRAGRARGRRSVASRRSARRRPARRPCSTPCIPAAAGRAGRARRGCRRCRGRCARWPTPPRPVPSATDPDARDEGPRVVPRRAVDRPPGSGRDVVGAAAARAGRRGRGRAEPATVEPRADDPWHVDPRRAGRVARRRRRAAAARRGRADASRRRPRVAATAGPTRRASASACRRPSTRRPHELEALAATDRGACRRGGRRDLRGAGPVRPRPGHRRSGPGARSRRARAADDAILARHGDQADQLAAVDDDYFRERAADVRDVGRRVAASSAATPRPTCGTPTDDPAILVADDLDPSAVATLRRELVAGIALAGGAPTGHAAIVARALGIPLVLGLGPARSTPSLTASTVAVDGTRGRLVDRARRRTTRRDAPRSTAERRPSRRRRRPSTPRAGRGRRQRRSALEAEAAVRAGADGVGLVRTELLFLGRHDAPAVAEQRATYARIRAAVAGRPVVFRTLDVGGDKPATWQDGPCRGEPRPRGPRHPARPAPAGASRRPAAGAGRGVGRRRSAGDVSDGRHLRGVRRGPRAGSRQSSRVWPQAGRPPPSRSSSG